MFAVATESRFVRLYSMQANERTPFATFDLRDAAGYCVWTGMQISNDGKYILVSTSGLAHILVDAFQVCVCVCVCARVGGFVRARQYSAHVPAPVCMCTRVPVWRCLFPLYVITARSFRLLRAIPARLQPWCGFCEHDPRWGPDLAAV